jgi:capsular polysaccharide biosynthesis protein
VTGADARRHANSTRTNRSDRKAAVDLNEAAERIFKYHWVLILVVTLLGVAVPVVLDRFDEDSYVATSRIAIGAEDARDLEEANSMADTALAMATSPGVFNQALETAGVRPTAGEAGPEVRVQPVGTSGVLQLSVTHSDSEAAARIANTLAELVVAQRTATVLGDTQALLAQSEEQIAQLTETVAALGVEADAAARAEAAARLRGEVPAATLDAIRLRYSQAVDQLSAAQAQRQELATTLAQAARPEVLDVSATEGVLVDTSLAARIAVGALLGFILGIALAATWEAFRPTVSAAGLARHLGVPLLGRLRRLPDSAGALQDKWLASYVTLAADGAGVHSFELVPVGPEVDVTGLARSLASETEGSREIVPVALDGPHDTRPPVQMASPGTGVVVVAPDRVKSSWLGNLERHVRLTRQPVIGVIAYGGKAHGPVPQKAAATSPQARPGVQPADTGSAAPVTS